MVIRRAFRDAEDYRAARDHAAAEGKPFSRDLGKETLVRVLDGELAWDQHTHRHDDIATAIRLADEFGYRLVVNHGTEGDKIADVLAERGIPVIFGPMITSRPRSSSGTAPSRTWPRCTARASSSRSRPTRRSCRSTSWCTRRPSP